MKYVTKCNFLKSEIKKSKEGKEYALISLLDDEQNSYKFFAFEDLKNKFLGANLQILQPINCCFEGTQINNNWQVRLLDFVKVEGNGNK